MQPATIRRLLVFGVCALGVGALYLLPGVSGVPQQLSGTGTAREPDPALAPVAYDTRAHLDRTGRAVDRSGSADSETAGASTLTPLPEPPNTRDRSGRWSGQQGSSPAWGGEQSADAQAPSTVSDLSFPVVTYERLTVRWPAASDNVRVASYRIWLNGYRVADTPGLQVAIPWFKDGSHSQVVQVRAVDAAGNQSEQAPARLVERPAPPPDAPPVDVSGDPASSASTPTETPPAGSAVEAAPGSSAPGSNPPGSSASGSGAE